MVYTNNKRIGVIYRTLQLGMLFYVIWSTITGSLYLKVYDAQGLITGWLEPGYMTNSTILINGRAQQYYPTTCTGTGQQSRCTIGQPQAADIVNPPYCGTPYTDDYVQNVHFDYGRVKCARFGEYDVGLKRTPTYFFVSTCIHDREYILDKCDVAGSTCNTTSTNFLGKVGESCQCRNVNNYYPINPEGIMVYLKHEFNSHAMSGNSRVRGTVPEVTTYLRRKGSTDNLYTFNAGSNIELSVGQLLRTANVNLDDYAPLDQVTPSTTDFGAAGGNMPFNRMTGVCLLLDMEYMNFNVDKDSESGIAIDDWDKKVSCIVTISRIGSWCSMGSEAAADKSTTFTQVSGKVYAQKSKVLDRYRQGIKIIFRQHGSIGDLDPFKIVDAFIQGVVLLGVATNLTTLIANNTIPGLDWMLGLEDFAAIFSRYYATPVRIPTRFAWHFLMHSCRRSMLNLHSSAPQLTLLLNARSSSVLSILA